ncbi:hypothetical protein QAD02_005983 [Eretmocerus hayati]|uniref:Uncharacterized protein n=1 Tax=Eretmocerus hayati TaxID=131215 RepID=A0ACC2N0F5_9HYME|nr:hypothetical protein QAD02_005983 [Eretmocerus hayati]
MSALIDEPMEPDIDSLDEMPPAPLATATGSSNQPNDEAPVIVDRGTNEDLFAAVFDEAQNLTDYSEACETSLKTDRFLQVKTLSGDTIMARKSSLWHRIRKGYKSKKLSSDRTLRVRSSNPNRFNHNDHPRPSLEDLSMQDEIHVLDWCVFKSENSEHHRIGMVLAFGYLEQNSWTKINFSKRFATIEPPSIAANIPGSIREPARQPQIRGTNSTRTIEGHGMDGLEEYTEKFFEILLEQGRLKVGQPQKNILIYSRLAHRDNLVEEAKDFDKFIEGLQQEVRMGVYKRNLEAHGITDEIVSQNPREYFGNYYDDPEEFHFSMGEKSNLRILLRLCTDRSETRLIRESTWTRLQSLELGQKTRPVTLPQGQTMNQNSMEAEKKKILSQINKDNRRKPKHKFDDDMKDKLKDVAVTVKIEKDKKGESQVVARIKCPICGIKIKTTKTKKARSEAGEGSWSAWNFVVHFGKHSKTAETSVPESDAVSHQNLTNGTDQHVSQATGPNALLVVEAEVEPEIREEKSRSSDSLESVSLSSVPTSSPESVRRSGGSANDSNDDSLEPFAVDVSLVTNSLTHSSCTITTEKNIRLAEM